LVGFGGLVGFEGLVGLRVAVGFGVSAGSGSDVIPVGIEVEVWKGWMIVGLDCWLMNVARGVEVGICIVAGVEPCCCVPVDEDGILVVLSVGQNDPSMISCSGKSCSCLISSIMAGSTGWKTRKSHGL
jgi:hypothetical protein